MFLNLNDVFGGPKPSAIKPQIGFVKKTMMGSAVPYEVIESNWFTSKPYGFRFTDRDDNSFTMFLPINPSNLMIQTGFATNTIATLYGTVEEHSPVRYFDITIEGTTGMSPKYVDVEQKQSLAGRSSFPVAQGLAGAAGGFFAKTLALADKVKNSASDLINGAPKPQSGLAINQTGYLAFHNLYRFLLKYKEDASGATDNNTKRKVHPLTFFNYKDNNQYDVVVRNFVLRKSADNPMLYNYSITLRGYNLRTASDGASIEDQTADRLKQLGLDGVDSSSLLGDIKATANKVRGVLGPLGAGINVLGR